MVHLEPVKAKDFKEKYQRPLNLKRWYQQMGLHGLDFGTEFRGFENIKHHAPSRTTTGQGDAKTSYKSMPNQSRYLYHPTAIDLCLQLIMLTFFFAPPYFNHIFVPVFIEDIYFATPHTVTHQFSMVATTDTPGRNRGNGTVQALDCETGQILMDFTGVGWKSMDEDPTAYRLRSEAVGPLKAPYARSVWKPDIDRLGPNMRGVFIGQETDCGQLITDMERLVRLWSSLMLDSLENEAQPTKGFLTNYVEWLNVVTTDNKTNEIPLSNAERLAEVDRLYNLHEKACPDMQLMKRVFENFLPLVAGTKEPIEILMGEDDLLSRFYTTGLGCDILSPILKEITDLLVHKNSDMKILEIGAGTGGTTSPVLSALCGANGMEQRFSTYFYTDISLGFFANARDRFQGFKGIEYKTLDIEKSPAAQGFEENSFDLIFAGDVLHATKSMKRTMENVRSLLKPGGKLVMVEITNTLLRLPFIMGILPGWWLGIEDGRRWSPTLLPDQWTALLRSTGFSGIDTQIDDFASKQDQLYSVLVSTAVEPTRTVETQPIAPPNVSVIYREMDDLTQSVLENLRERHAPGQILAYPIVSKETKLGDHVIVLAELVNPMLSNITELEWEGIKHLIGNAASALWITSGGQMEGTNPEAAMINGLARSIRTETAGAIELYSLDLDSSRLIPECINETIIRCLQTIKSDVLREGPKDYELAERNGVIYLNRLLPDARFEDEVTTLLGMTSPQMISTWEPKPTVGWEIDVKQPGSLESIGFAEYAPETLPLPETWVEIEVEAVGLNWEDGLTCMGYTTYKDFDLGMECAGVVSKTGKDVTGLTLGDMVYAFGRRTFTSHYRTSQELCKRIPTTVTAEVAAGSVMVNAAVLHTLRDVAQIAKDQFVLIHSAAGALGLAAVQHCQSIGCEIFATVSTEEKKTFLCKTFDIPAENIFNSRDSSFYHGLMRRTDRKGVDVVLSSMSGDLLHYGWRCVKKFGHFFDLRKLDVIEGSSLDMRPFGGYRTFRSIDLTDFAASRPAAFGNLIQDTLDLLGNGFLRPLTEVEVFPINKVHDAFRHLQNSKRIGKTAVRIDGPVDPSLFHPSRRNFQIPGEGTVFLVGGLGGLGRTFSRYIVELGARHVTFISRSGPKPEDGMFIEMLEDLGCAVYAARCDISVRADLEQVLQEVSMPVIGVIQGAMVLEVSQPSAHQMAAKVEQIYSHAFAQTHVQLKLVSTCSQAFHIRSSVNTCRTGNNCNGLALTKDCCKSLNTVQSESM